MSHKANLFAINKETFAMGMKEKHCLEVINRAVGDTLYVWPKVKLRDLLIANSAYKNNDLS